MTSFRDREQTWAEGEPHEQRIEWLTPTENQRIAVVKWPDPRKGPWRIEVHWALVNGRAQPVGVDLRSFTEHEHDDGTLHRATGWQGLAEVTAKVWRDLPIASVIEESRADLSTPMSDLPGIRLDAKLTDREVESASKMSTVPPGTTDGLLRLVAQLYREAIASGPPYSRKPSRYVEDRLREHGVQLDAASSGTRVRKLVHRARQAGYLPPTAERTPGWS